MNKRYEYLGDIIKIAGELLKKGYENNDMSISIKSGRELVTNYDKKIEKLLIKSIKEEFPNDNFLAEESFEDYSMLDNDNFVWIIDPIDGTNNFAHRIPIFAISVGLYKNGENLFGMVYNPITDEFFWASKGNGAYLNGKEIKVSNTKNFNESIFSTGFAYNRSTIENSNVREFANVAINASGIRRLGAASLDICYVAAGKIEGYWEYNLKPWDIAGGIVIAKEAGAIVSNIQGEEYKFPNGDIVVSTKNIKEDLVQKINNI